VASKASWLPNNVRPECFASTQAWHRDRGGSRFAKGPLEKPLTGSTPVASTLNSTANYATDAMVRQVRLDGHARSLGVAREF
jgi:hypothetical protein